MRIIWMILLLLLLDIPRNRVPAVAGGCVFPDYLETVPNRVWWSHNGRIPRSFSFKEVSRKQNFPKLSEFDLAATAEGWHQISVDPDLRSFWIQHFCLIPEARKSYDTRTDPCQFKYLEQAEELTPEESYPVQYRVECVKSVSVTRSVFLVKQLIGSGIYQCLEFQRIDGTSVIRIRKTAGFTNIEEEAQCTSSFPSKSEIYMPSLDLSPHPVWTECPFSGGFQITSLWVLKQNRSIFCDYQTFANLEVNCIHHEETSWSFDESTCNPFEFNQVTQMQCSANWTLGPFNIVILRKQREDHGHTVYSMVYQQMPPNLSRKDTHYKASTHLWLAQGLELAALTTDFVEVTKYRTKFSSALFRDHLLELHRSARATTEIFEMEFRAAFGSCDDERTSCDLGCGHNARNRMFCYRTCGSDSSKCDQRHWDSCRFDENYHGTWDLIETVSARSTKMKTSSQQIVQQLRISKNHVDVTYFKPGDRKQMQFQCIRKVGESVSDWFIVRTVFEQSNGCRPRDFCLDLYQSRLKRFSPDRNNNTLLYRLSTDGKVNSEAKSLCQRSSGTWKAPLERFKVFVRSSNCTTGQEVQTSGSKIKCGLYQMRLEGKAIFNWFLTNPQFQFVDDQSRIFIPTLWPRENTQFPHKHHSAPYTLVCDVQMTDFNSTVGSTGEFDDRLRVKTWCGNETVPSFLESSFQCLSVYDMDGSHRNDEKRQFIITYNERTKSYFCWHFRRSHLDLEIQWEVTIVSSPQCHFHEMLENLHPDEENVLGFFRLRTGMCSECQGDRPIPEPTKPAKKQENWIPGNMPIKLRYSSISGGSSMGREQYFVFIFHIFHLFKT